MAMTKPNQTPVSARWWILFLLWFCVLAVAFLIFGFSEQGGEESTATSDRVVRVIITITHPEFETLSKAQQLDIWSFLSFIVRKSAHFIEYAALGFFVRLLMASYSLRRGALWAWLGGTLFAASDELHQLFTAGRSGAWQDVALDSSGVFFGALAAAAFMWVYRHISRRRSSVNTP